MKPERITSLSAVREVLNKAPSQHMTLFKSLMDNGKNHPHGCKPAQRLVFGPGESDFPGLGKKLSPFDANKLPSPEDLQKLLITDLQKARQQFSHYSDHVLHNSEERATNSSGTENDILDFELLNSLTDTVHNTSSGILSFPSSLLDDICGDTKVDYDHVLRESITNATVLARNTLLSLEHSNEGTTFTTLLSGTIAWIIWPPTEWNLEVLQSSYEALSESFDGTETNVADRLEDGVCLVQTVGEAIRIPPFCPILCLSLETSVLATYSVVTVDQLAGMLRKLPLLQAWFKTEVDGERKKLDLIAVLLNHLFSVLQGNFEPTDIKRHKYPYVQRGPLYSLLHTWDHVKDNVARMLSPADTERVKGSWADFLRNTRGRECWICGQGIRNKSRNSRKHFEVKHWPAEMDAEVLEHQHVPHVTPEEVIVPHVIREETGHELSEDNIEMVGPKRVFLKNNSKRSSPHHSCSRGPEAHVTTAS